MTLIHLKQIRTFLKSHKDKTFVAWEIRDQFRYGYNVTMECLDYLHSIEKTIKKEKKEGVIRYGWKG